jgi:uncharacterized repeat protein (TIGR03803 family)
MFAVTLPEHAMRQNLLAASLLTATAFFSGQAGAETLTTFYSFQGGADGSAPAANIAVDSAGNIYGANAGRHSRQGTVWELSPPAAGQTTWTETVLWQFDHRTGGLSPLGGIIRDRRGNLYGTAVSYGEGACGTLFELEKTGVTWVHNLVWTFGRTPSDACHPSAALVIDANGALYGNTFFGGANNDGAAFKLAPPAAGRRRWTESLLWSFGGSVDGSEPSTQMLFDAAGNLYGTSYTGGANDAGTVWQLTPPAAGQTAWSLQVLWTPTSAQCQNPTRGPLIMDATGALYGTCHGGGTHNMGVVFKLSPPTGGGTAWTESTIWSFNGGKDGSDPTSGVVFGHDGSLIGATDGGNGGVFELRPPAAGQTRWQDKQLWTFSGADGADPELPLVLRSHGVILGTALNGGLGNGTVWELTP